MQLHTLRQLDVRLPPDPAEETYPTGVRSVRPCPRVCVATDGTAYQIVKRRLYVSLRNKEFRVGASKTIAVDWSQFVEVERSKDTVKHLERPQGEIVRTTCRLAAWGPLQGKPVAEIVYERRERKRQAIRHQSALQITAVFWAAVHPGKLMPAVPAGLFARPVFLMRALTVWIISRYRILPSMSSPT